MRPNLVTNPAIGSESGLGGLNRTASTSALINQALQLPDLPEMLTG
jgi:hypothetical protein